MAAKKKTKATKTTKKPGRAAPSKAPKKASTQSAKKKAAPPKKAAPAAPRKKAAPVAISKKASPPVAPSKKATPAAPSKKPGGPAPSLKRFVQKVRDCEAGTRVWFITAGSVEHAVIQKRGGDGAIVIRTDAGATEAVSADNLFETADEARAARFL